MEVYLSKLYMPIVFGDAALSVPSFIGSKVWSYFGGNLVYALQDIS